MKKVKEKYLSASNLIRYYHKCLLLLAAVLLGASATAQQYVLPLSGADTRITVAFDGVRLSAHRGDTISLNMRVCVVGELARGQRVSITPRLVADSLTARLPAIDVYGRWAYYHALRAAAPACGDTLCAPRCGGDTLCAHHRCRDTLSVQYRDRELTTFSDYCRLMPLEPWMRRATLVVDACRLDGRGDTLAHEVRALAAQLTEGDTLTPPPPPLTRRLRAFRPWMALKTNLLYDAALAPNIEVEVPLDRHGRWSLMAEYCNPWWRWSRKSNSYQIQMGGVELRRWLAPRGDQSRPLLCGHFAAVYGQFGQYDLERRDVGDQGDFGSAGVTYGYAWPLSRRLNMELSIAAGVLWGKRRHYNAEFDSSHLIYKYTKNLFYAGPTKLKLSLVWMIGNKK